jgi:SAM-dependent methyltransferase
MLIDIGTGLGQDLRKLVLDGAAPSQLFGVDKLGQFEELSFNFFRDNNNFANVFTEADILSQDKDNALLQTIGTWDIVTSSMFLHAFDWQTQVAIVKKMMTLAKGKGSWMIGMLAGDIKSQEVPIPAVLEGMKVTRFIHNEQSLRRLFEEAQVGMSMKLKVEVDIQEDEKSVYTKELQSGFFTTEKARLFFYFVEIV